MHVVINPGAPHLELGFKGIAVSLSHWARDHVCRENNPVSWLNCIRSFPVCNAHKYGTWFTLVPGDDWKVLVLSVLDNAFESSIYIFPLAVHLDIGRQFQIAKVSSSPDIAFH